MTLAELTIETFSVGSSSQKMGELLTVCALLLIMLTITKLQCILSDLMYLASLKPDRDLQAHPDPSPNNIQPKIFSLVILCFHKKSQLVSVFSFPFPSFFTELKVLQKFQETCYGTYELLMSHADKLS